MDVNFDYTLEDAKLFDEIADRALANVKMDLAMVIAACHLNGCPLDLKKLLTFEDADFFHDINGISEHINRNTGKLENFFLPRCAKMDTPKQLRKIHPLDFPIEVFLADLTTRPANIIRAELAAFSSYAGTGTFDIEPPFTVRHLCMFSRSEMRKWPNFGRKCLNEVEEMLRARGLQLWENHDERSLRLLREHKDYFA